MLRRHVGGNMTILRRALVQGLAFGIAATTVGLWLQMIGFVQRRMGASVPLMLQTSALEILLALLLGLLALPLLWLRGGRVWHVLALALLWLGLERWVTLDSPLFRQMELVVPAAATLLTLLGLWLARRWPRLPWALGGLLFAGALAAPTLYLRSTTPAVATQGALPPAKAGAPDVVLVVLDTVRAGNVSTYGYARPTAPALDQIAREGALFLDATSPSTWSLPSHASLFTGRYPSSHGAHGEHRFLDDRYPTLASALAHNGYETFCFTSNAWISDGLGLTRGFAHQDTSLMAHGGAGRGFSFIFRLLDRLGLQETDKGGTRVADSFEQWAKSRPADADRPAFVFLNFIEAHFPYHQLPHDDLFRFTDLPYATLRSISVDLMGQQFGGKGRSVEEAGGPARDMYDGGVVHTSDLLGRVVEALRARGTLDRTVLVVLADHGEILGERGDHFGHGPSFYQESVGVPLLVRYPARIPAGTRVATPVSTLGVYATIFDLAGLEAPPTLQVGSLAPLATGAADAGGPILAELHPLVMDTRNADAPAARDPQMHLDRRYRLFREGSLKLVTSSKGDALLYDLAADPRESRDLSAERPADLARMQAQLAQVGAQIGLPALDAPLAVGDAAPELDEATRARLRELGYAE
jgi:arylsulfatase A-like enzyme